MFIVGVLFVFQGPSGAVGIAGVKGPTVSLLKNGKGLHSEFCNQNNLKPLEQYAQKPQHANKSYSLCPFVHMLIHA